MEKTLIGPFAQLLPLTGLPVKGALKDDQLLIISDGGLLVSGGKILEVGPFYDLNKHADEIIEVNQPSICLPGFIDAHTHICFGGSRANDSALRTSGKTYLDSNQN